MLTISPARIDLWLAYCENLTDALLARYHRLLTHDERCRQQSFHFARDRRRYIVSRALLRTVLSRYAPTAPQEWQFAANAYGRPCIVNPGEREQAICFNLSHTSEVVLLGVSGVRALGVDVERINAATTADGVAEQFFAGPEVASLRALPSEARPHRFFEYWTLKESYIKARGMGLSIPLDSFEFDLSLAACIGFSVAESQADARRWRFWQIRPAAGHVGAVCAQRHGGSMDLSLRAVVPLASEEAIDCDVVRRTSDT